MANNHSNSNLIHIQAASPLDDLRIAPPYLRYIVAFLGAALLAYLIAFGVLAIFGFWRNSLFSLQRIGLAASILCVQSGILWLCRVKPGLGGTVFGLLWTIPLSVVILKASGPNDLLQALILISLPLVLCMLNGLAAGLLLKKLDLSATRRRKSPE